MTERQRKRGTAGALLAWTGKTVFRPYIEAPKALARLPRAMNRLTDAIAGFEEANNRVEWDHSPDGHAAFAVLFEGNGWDDEQLSQQRRAVVRTKWFSLGLAMASMTIGTSTAALFGAVSYWPIVAAVIGCAIGVISVFRFFQCAIFQTQIDLRELITAREFVSRSDMINRMLSS